MVDIFTTEKRSHIMRQIHATDTTPELRVRRSLFQQGFRYRLHKNGLPGRPDIVLPRYKTVVFIHGCFWHGHVCKIGSGARRPKTNANYWNTKIEKNIARDELNKAKLLQSGWEVIIIRECESSSDRKLKQLLMPLLKKKGILND